MNLHILNSTFIRKETYENKYAIIEIYIFQENLQSQHDCICPKISIPPHLDLYLVNHSLSMYHKKILIQFKMGSKEP